MVCLGHPPWRPTPDIQNVRTSEALAYYHRYSAAYPKTVLHPDYLTLAGTVLPSGTGIFESGTGIFPSGTGTFESGTGTFEPEGRRDTTTAKLTTVKKTMVIPVIHQAEYDSVGVYDSTLKSGIRLYVWKNFRISERTAPIKPIVQIEVKARKINTNWEAKSIFPQTMVPCLMARLYKT